MKSYHHFSVEDFVWDEAFRQWVLRPDRESDLFWTQWLAENPGQADNVAQASEIVKAVGPVAAHLSDDEREHAILQIMDHFDEQIGQETEHGARRRELWTTGWFKVACVLVLATGFAWLFIRYDARKPTSYDQLVSAAAIEMHEVRNTSDSTHPIILSDGSVVTLDPGSKLSFPAQFTGTKREVYLSGGAFFDVARFPDRPFFVYADEVVTKVLGTSFHVRSYQNEQAVSVSVKTGRVAVFTRKPEEDDISAVNELSGMVIEPNQQITVARKTVKMTRSLVADPAPVIADNHHISFQFDDSPVSEIFKTLHKAYGIEIIFDENTMKDCPVTATLTELSLYEKLDLVCNAVGAKYSVIDGRIVVDGKGCL